MAAYARIRIAQQVNYTIQNISPLVCKVHLPGGFPYEAFDYEVAKVRPKSLLSTFESSHIVSYWPKEGKSYLEMNNILNDRLFFLAAINMQVKPEIYLKESPKYPLIITHHMSFLGKTSQRVTSILSSSTEDIQYAQMDAQHVFVDPLTRKPAQLPNWWMEKFGNLKPEDGKPLKLAELQRPSTCLCYEFPVHPGDCDDNGHTNWKNYGFFCYDACCVFACTSQYRQLNRDIFANGLKSISMSFIKESSELEVLSLYSWEDDSIPQKVYFEIHNQQKQTLCQVIIEFFSDLPENKVSIDR